MITVHSETHRRRAATTELSGGRLLPPFEKPERVEMILARIAETGLGPVAAPSADGLPIARRIHDAEYLEFLAGIWDAWVAAGHAGEAIPSVWPARRMTDRRPEDVEGQLGYFAFAAETSISSGTWEAACAAADVAATGAALLGQGHGSAFALCRPPGHHAARDLFGGYCFLNNAGVAAEALLAGGAGRVAILDVDYHHGNGTQDIFWDRDEVFFASLHAAPEHAFPHFSGYADERGGGAGEGATLNLPLPPGTGWADWAAALDTALAAIGGFGPDALVVSFGADTYAGDPISEFRLGSEDFLRMGARLAALGRPTLFVMEGGYAVAALGVNTVNLLQGFEGAV